MSRGIVIRRVSSTDARALGDFFTAIAADDETVRFFHPHPFTREFAGELCRRAATCQDRYYVACYQDRVIAYMMLRGWDEGYAVPSFGVCTHPALRDVGLGQALLAHAVEESRSAVAPQLRLTVFKCNERAVHVYRKFGFVFHDKNERELVGLLDLANSPAIPVRPANLSKIRTWFDSRIQAA
jgi:[ribosomal protein S18]-alanine N-acetyltransferase